MSIELARRGWSSCLCALFFLPLLSLFLAPRISQGKSHVVQKLASRTYSDESDTASKFGGQVGGRLMGFGYSLLAMRCVTGQAIVGAKLRRGDALDYLQIACATPSCATGSCTWSSSQWGMSAGNPSGGDAHPAMLCQSNQVLTGIRGRVVSFTVPVDGRRTGFDYAADLEIECSQMTAPPVTGPSGHSFFPVAQGGTGAWHHPEGGFANAAPGVAPNVIETYIWPIISCKSRGYGATAVSVGIANFLGQASHPVVQAVSLFCPSIAPTQPATAANFRLMTQNDPMWTNANYAGTEGYFPNTATGPFSSCHGFVGEMGIATPGNNTCGNGFLTDVPHLPAGTPHQLGDVAVVYGHFAGAPFAWHSAIYMGCNFYLQKNGSSNIQVTTQNYIDNFTTNEQVFYVRPSGSLSTYTSELATLKAQISPSVGTTAANQAKITQIKNCFP